MLGVRACMHALAPHLNSLKGASKPDTGLAFQAVSSPDLQIVFFSNYTDADLMQVVHGTASG